MGSPNLFWRYGFKKECVFSLKFTTQFYGNMRKTKLERFYKNDPTTFSGNFTHTMKQHTRVHFAMAIKHTLPHKHIAHCMIRCTKFVLLVGANTTLHLHLSKKEIIAYRPAHALRIDHLFPKPLNNMLHLLNRHFIFLN